MPHLRLATAACILALTVAPLARADDCTTQLSCGADLQQATDLELRMNDHFWYGQALEAWYDTAARNQGDVALVGGWGDSGLWTGVYLGGESFRYAVARDKLAGSLDADQIVYWTSQRDEAKARVDAMVQKEHLLVNIAKAWRTEVSPWVHPNDTHTPASFGGGVIQGEPGMLMRACAPTDAPPEHAMATNRRVFGPWLWDDEKEYICETAPSRDTYAGVTFGLQAAFDLVSVDDPDMRAMIRDDILKLAGFLVKYGWNYPRPHGNISLPPLGHDFDNFISPLFVYVPMARLNMANVARHVADLAGTLEEKLRWDAVWQEEFASQGPILAGSMVIDSMQPNESYYKFNLHYLTGFNLLRTLGDPTERGVVAQAFDALDRTTGDDVNAHFEAITYAVTGEPAKRDTAITHLDEWRAYRATTGSNPNVDNSPGCGIDFACVPDDQLDVSPTGPDGEFLTWKPGTSTKIRAALPLPVAVRPQTDFLWQRPPTQLSSGYTDPRYEPPGVDYLTPYWMLRYLTEVAPPALAPLPESFAPSFR
ncbi:MAG: hypothetical protein HY775_02455 [Acidobacteria bacterium]|nr:hypothetical protein [Acidobacteriota bacterium]